MSDSNTQIIQRFEEFGKHLCGDKHGWKKKFADSLGVMPQQLNNMLTGSVNIGGIIQARLRDLGADVDYIMTGINREGTTEALGRRIQYEMPGHLTADDGEKIKKLLDEMGKVSSDDPDIIEKMITIMQTIYKKKT